MVSDFRGIYNRWKASGNGDDTSEMDDVAMENVVEMDNDMMVLNPLKIRSSNIIDSFVTSPIMRYFYIVLNEHKVLDLSIALMATGSQHGSGKGSTTSSVAPSRSNKSDKGKGAKGAAAALGVLESVHSSTSKIAEAMSVMAQQMKPPGAADQHDVSAATKRKYNSEADFAEQQTKYAKTTAHANANADFEEALEKLASVKIKLLQTHLVNKLLGLRKQLDRYDGLTEEEVGSSQTQWQQDLTDMVAAINSD